MGLSSPAVDTPDRDLDLAVTRHQSVFELGDPDLTPLHDLAEFDLDAFWLLPALAPELADCDGIYISVKVKNSSAERHRFAQLNVVVSELQRFEGVVEFSNSPS